MAAIASIEQGFFGKLTGCDLVLARTTRFVQQAATANLGRVYRFKHLFKDPDTAVQHKQIEFVGGGGSWGEIPNYVGEVGFLFLDGSAKSIYQCSWHGHIPIERHDDGLWCLLYQIKLWEYQDVPSILRDNFKPSIQRLYEGQSFDTWVRFEALETYLMDLIAELDQKPCVPLVMADIRPWLESVKHA